MSSSSCSVLGGNSSRSFLSLSDLAQTAAPSEAGVLIMRQIACSARLEQGRGRLPDREAKKAAARVRLSPALAHGAGRWRRRRRDRRRPAPATAARRRRRPAPARSSRAGRHVLDPLRRVDQRQVAAGQAGAGAAEHHGEIADADDVDAERMRRAVIVADRAQRQAGARPEQEPGDSRRSAGSTGRRAGPGRRAACRRKAGRKAGNVERRSLMPGWPTKLSPIMPESAEAEQRQRKAGRHLVGDQRQRQEAEQQREQRADDDRREDAEPRRAGGEAQRRSR